MYSTVLLCGESNILAFTFGADLHNRTEGEDGRGRRMGVGRRMVGGDWGMGGGKGKEGGGGRGSPIL